MPSKSPRKILPGSTLSSFATTTFTRSPSQTSAAGALRLKSSNSECKFRSRGIRHSRLTNGSPQSIPSNSRTSRRERAGSWCTYWHQQRPMDRSEQKRHNDLFIAKINHLFFLRLTLTFSSRLKTPTSSKRSTHPPSSCVWTKQSQIPSLSQSQAAAQT